MPLWDIGICIPSKVKPKTEMEEKLFFESCSLPIDSYSSNE
jgi:hypothetical protein